MASGEGRAITPIDRHVGSRVKQRRLIQSMSQEDLAAVMEISFQQIQKYERAASKISASRLFELAQALEVPVTYFYEGMPSGGVETYDDSREKSLMSREGMAILGNLAEMTAHQRKALLALSDAMVNPEGPGKG